MTAGHDGLAVGARLRAERERRGWSRGQLAGRLRLHLPDRQVPDLDTLASYIKRWEAGKVRVSGRYRHAYAAAFEIEETSLFSEYTTRGCDGSLLDLSTTFQHARAAPTSFHGPVAPELVLYFLEQLPGHYKADMWLGPRHLIPTVTTQAQLIDELTRSADATVRRGLLGAGVAYAALLGWLHQDAGDIHRSAQWRNIALDMAHRSGDAQLISYALTNKAMLAVDLGDGRAVVDYSEAALAEGTRLCPKVRVLGLVHLAHGHAFLRDRDAVDAALDRAADLIGQVDDEHPWGNACRRTPKYIDVQRATAYVRLGAHHEAVAVWDRVLGSAPLSARRDNGVFRTRQAAALAAVPEPERVVEIAAATAEVISETGSARLRRELLTLPKRAAKWNSTRAGHELSEIIAGIA